MKGFDLFSGIGGFHEGAKNLLKENFQAVAFCDFDEKSRKAYRSAYKDQAIIEFHDVNDITGELRSTILSSKKKSNINKILPDFDILFGGFPCQPFSSMGKGKGFEDDRGVLFFNIEMILKAKKPKYFILENVRGLMSIQNGDVMSYIIKSLERMGYQSTYWLLNAADYGVPQTRRRVFIVGELDGDNLNINPKTPPPRVPIHRRRIKSIKELLLMDVDDKYYLSEKIKKTILSDGTGGYKYKSQINMDPARPLTYTMHKMHRASQDNYYSDEYIKGGSKDRIRRITPYEALLIQGFKKNTSRRIINSGLSDTQLYKLAGNAVSPAVVKEVMRHLLNFKS